MGLFSAELIFEGAYYWREFCVSKLVGLDNKNSSKDYKNSLKQVKTANPNMGLYLGGRIFGRIFSSEIWGAYFREGLFWGGGGGAYSRNFTVFVQKAVLLGLFSGELIFGGCCYWKEFCVSIWVELDNKTASNNSVWAYIWEGLLSEGFLRLRFGGLIFGRAYFLLLLLLFFFFFFLGGGGLIIGFYGAITMAAEEKSTEACGAKWLFTHRQETFTLSKLAIGKEITMTMTKLSKPLLFYNIQSSNSVAN